MRNFLVSWWVEILIVALSVIGIGLFILLLAYPGDTECFDCERMVCGQGLACVAGCVCAKDPNLPFGRCVTAW